MPKKNAEKKVKLITRTIETHTIRAEAYKFEAGKKVPVEIDPLTITTNGMDTSKAIKLLTERDKTLMYLVTDISTVKKTYGLSEEVFMKYAMEISKEKENN